jgi:hypothetical protein
MQNRYLETVIPRDTVAAMGVFVEQWVQGKKSRKGRPLPYVVETVVVVTTDVIDRFLGAATPRQRTAHLRFLRDSGKLIHSRGLLTAQVRRELRRPGRGRVYVFRYESPEDVPRCRRRRQPGKGRIGRVFTV